jgi:hypothetical protein
VAPRVSFLYGITHHSSSARRRHTHCCCCRHASGRARAGMVLLTPAELQTYNCDGYVVIAIPSGTDLTALCLDAARRLQLRATPEEVASLDGKGNHWRLRPLTAGSYWSALDHSLPFLQTCLHPETLEIGRQLAGHGEIWLRNAGA